MIRLRVSVRSTCALHQRRGADHDDRAEQDDQDAAHHRRRDGLQDGAELADEGQHDREDRGDVMIERVEGLGERHRAGDLGVRGVGRAAEEAGEAGREAVAEQRAVQPGLLEVVDLPVTPRMATRSPTCSMAGAMATGRMNRIAGSEKVGSTKAGMANQAASRTGVRSTIPRTRRSA
jgi:hypothetical protein